MCTRIALHRGAGTVFLLPLVTGDDDPLDVEGLATHRVPLDEAPHMYEAFQKKQDGAIKVVLQPRGAAAA